MIRKRDLPKMISIKLLLCCYEKILGRWGNLEWIGEVNMKGKTVWVFDMPSYLHLLWQVLRHLGRISECRIGHHRVITLLRPQWITLWIPPLLATSIFLKDGEWGCFEVECNWMVKADCFVAIFLKDDLLFIV